MKTRAKGIVLVLASTVFTAAGQILYKKASGGFVPDPSVLLANYPLFFGMAAYGLGAIMLIVALRYGQLSVLYPIYALNFVWVSVLSPMFFRTDSMSPLKWAGVALIIAGVSTIGRVGSGGELG